MAVNNRRGEPSGLTDSTLLLLIVTGALLGATLLVDGAVWLGRLIVDRTPPDLPGLFATPLALVSGDVAWPGTAGWIVLALEFTAVVTLAALAADRWYARRQGVGRVDAQARYLGRGPDIESLTEANARRTAERLDVASPVPGLTLGVRIGPGASARSRLMMTWEDQMLAIAGPRTGKTTSLVVPAILDAPGAVLTTSNKRDVVDCVTGPRTRVGRVWTFDPQDLLASPPDWMRDLPDGTLSPSDLRRIDEWHRRDPDAPDWYWDPLSYVTDETRAEQLANHFASSASRADARADAYFDPAGRSLVAALLLAAALDGRPITRVWDWLNHPNDRTPVGVLDARGYPLVARQLEAIVDLTARQRDGVFGTAQQMCRVLSNRRAVRWVVPRAGAEEFRPDAFVRSRDTLCSMSKEGAGSAGAFVLALTAAVVEAAEEYAMMQPGGRLRTPMTCVLDEAANVCRWHELPDRYSHYGSRGIVLMTFLQSWSQGVDVWGEAGMSKLFSAANKFAYLGGVRESRFLEDLSASIGDYDRLSRSYTSSASSDSVSGQLTRDRILGVDDLMALPPRRAVILAGGSRPVLARTVPWMERDDAPLVRQSLREAS